MIPTSSTGMHNPLQICYVLSWPQAKLIPVPGFSSGAFKASWNIMTFDVFQTISSHTELGSQGPEKGWEEGFPMQRIFHHSSICSHLHKFRKHRLYWNKYPHNHKGCVNKLTALPGENPKPHTPGLVSAFPWVPQGLSPCRSCSSPTSWPGLLIFPNQLLQKNKQNPALFPRHIVLTSVNPRSSHRSLRRTEQRNWGWDKGKGNHS